MQPVPVELSAEALSVQYRIVERARRQLEHLESGFKEQIKGMIRSGVNVPGYRAEEGTGHLRWVKPLKEIINMGDILGQNLRKEGAVTPTAALKLGINSDVINNYSETPKTGIKIVSDADNKARKIFSK